MVLGLAYMQNKESVRRETRREHLILQQVLCDIRVSRTVSTTLFRPRYVLFLAAVQCFLHLYEPSVLS